MKMKEKIFAVLATTFLILTIFSIAYVPKASSGVELPDYEAVDWQSGLAGPVEMPTIEETMAGVQTVETLATTPPVGTVVWDWYLWAISRNDPGGAGQKAWMTLMAKAGNVEVWVQNDLTFPAGDPRNAIPSNYTILPVQAQYIADVFNTIIYPTDTLYFGMPYDRDGSGNIFIGSSYPTAPPNWWYWIEAPDNPQRVILKVLNCRDTNYYDPLYPSYTAGFYTATYTRTYYKRNMIHIDCWQWWRRLGPVGTYWYPDKCVPPDRANLYESVVAHEFQHNIHRDWNPNDVTFMNEGCSEYSQILCGWPHTLWSHINNYLFTPDNSLTVWGDQGDINILADYGAAALWTTYLSDHYGGAATISHFVQAGIPGIDGVNAALEYYGYTQRFNDIYYDWRIANLIHSNLVADSRYNYKTLDLGSASAIPAFRHTVSGIPVPWTKGTDFGTTWGLNGYDTGVSKVGPYGSDYIVMDQWDKMGIIYFDGDDTVVYGWTQTAGVWWSGAQNMLDTLIYSEAYVQPADPTLQLVTKWDTESLYDYGFVQVSTDGGNTWVSLSNAYTISNHASDLIPPILAYLPGLNGRSTGYPVFRTITFDLSAYAGLTVRIGFRYMTDPGTLGAGWYIQDAKVSGASLTLTAVYPEADFQVSVVRVYMQGGALVNYLVNDVTLEDATETGNKGANVVQPNYVILVVSPVMPLGFADYQFRARIPPIRANQ